MGGKGFKLSPGDMSKASTSMKGFSSKLKSSSSKVDSTHDNLTSKMSGDKSGFGGVFSKVISKTKSAFSDMGQQLSRVTGGAGDRLEANGKAHSTNEADTESSFKKLAEDPKPSTTKTSSPSGPPPKTTTTSGSDYKEPTKKPTDSGEGGGETKPSGSGSNDKPTEPPKEPNNSGGGGPTKPSGSGGGGGGGDDPKKPSGSGGGGGGGDPKKPSGDESPEDDSPEPPLRPDHKPVTGDGPSTKITNKPKLDKPGPYTNKQGKKVPTPDQKFDMPSDRQRGSQYEKIDPDGPRVTKDPETGLIKTIDKKPVKQYLQEESIKQSHIAHDPEAHWRQKLADEGKTAPKKAPNGMPPKEKKVSSLAIDLRTGSVTSGVNGATSQVIPEKNLHPLLQQNYQDLRAYQHPVHEPKRPTDTDGRAHDSPPNQHAEVKATNELLWQRQAAGEAKYGDGYELPASTLGEIRVDPRWTSEDANEGAVVGGPAPCCANCNSILKGVPSYTGRYTYSPMDSRYESGFEKPHGES